MGDVSVWEGVPAGPTVEQVLAVLSSIRVSQTVDEYHLQESIRQCLDEAGVAYQKEHTLGARSRVDFYLPGGIVIEVKRGRTKPNRTQLVKQLTRYVSYDAVTAVIVVVDRNVHIPPIIDGKPCVVLGLHRLWGVAL